MGNSADNRYLGPHVDSTDTFTGYRFVIHQGDGAQSPRFTESPDCDATDRDDIIAAAGVSQSTFNTRIATQWSVWAGTLSTGDKIGLRQAALNY